MERVWLSADGNVWYLMHNDRLFAGSPRFFSSSFLCEVRIQCGMLGWDESYAILHKCTRVVLPEAPGSCR